VKDLDVDVYYHNFLNVMEGTELAGESVALGYDCDVYPLGYMGKYGHRFTKAPIPTRSLQPLKNAMVFSRDRNRFGVLLRGWSYAWKCARLISGGMKFRPFAVGLEFKDRSSDFERQFFQQFAGLSATLFYPEDVCFLEEELSEILKRLPLKNGRVHVIPARGSSAKRIRGIEEADQSTPYLIAFKELDFSTFADDGRRIFVEINDRKDFESLARFFQLYMSENREGLSYQQAEILHFDLFESCRWFRWFDTTCPAASLTHIYCDESGGLRPCVHYPAMGDVRENVPLEEFRERTERHFTEKTRERGCEGCPVKTKCPQCIAPFPLTDEEYCNFQMHLWAKGKPA
jgi:radical SAM protein with 4Fe4S-binding SPASM domain